MNIYFISGLGADKRVFARLQLPESFSLHYIEWVLPGPEETLAEYARRLLPQIDQHAPFALIGVSYGGMIAIELAKHCSPFQIIIVSSISGPAELSSGLKRMGKFRFHRLIPTSFLLRPSALLYRLFGTTGPEEKQLLRNILADTDPVFFRRAMNQMTRWDNTWKPAALLHLHGTEDHVLPYRENMSAVKINGGGHLMVYTHSAIVSTLLAETLAAALKRRG